MKSPVKWLSDRQYALSTFNYRAIAWADSQVGVREINRNRGEEVEMYQEVAGLGNGGGFAWCACFIYWCLIRAGVRKAQLPAPGLCAAVRNWAKWAKSRSRITKYPKRGDLFYWLNSDQSGHIGFCLGPSILGIFRTLEGNTDGESGSRDGDGVYKRTRTLWHLKSYPESGFISLKNL